jgi:preprotein translocase subunit YajC
VSALSQFLFCQTGGDGAGGPGNLLGGLAPFLIIFAIFYFLMIRPQQKQARDHKAMLGALRKGDEVVTNGGVIGKIYAVADKELMLEVARDVRIRVLKSSVQSRHVEAAADETAGAKEKEKKEEGR